MKGLFTVVAGLSVVLAKKVNFEAIEIVPVTVRTVPSNCAPAICDKSSLKTLKDLKDCEKHLRKCEIDILAEVHIPAEQHCFTPNLNLFSVDFRPLKGMDVQGPFYLQNLDLTSNESDAERGFEVAARSRISRFKAWFGRRCQAAWTASKYAASLKQGNHVVEVKLPSSASLTRVVEIDLPKSAGYRLLQGAPVKTVVVARRVINK